MSRIEGKIAVITGGTQGLGAAIAERFAAAGAGGIIIVGRDAEKGRGVADRTTGATGVAVEVVAADLADIDASVPLFQQPTNASARLIFSSMRRG